ncbi:MAG: twin-arginine translocase TatA/TatE family subunit [Oribacterium sp.]|nr:twin-arginine translocase TatA/TatE family subunit [Oribacterium sp.]MDY6307924.1 twin-arginine translocase TatA/TatE family subunit [Oribacterium sp.]MDY6316432.1 twin-arginine translocase TatA/TatE family subunit [Oribacterium sp.]
MFGRIGPMELILILIIALVIFGPSKLPQIGKALGESIKEFKKGASEISDVVNEPVKTEAQPKSDAPATTEVKKDETKTV